MCPYMRVECCAHAILSCLMASCWLCHHAKMYDGYSRLPLDLAFTAAPFVAALRPVGTRRRTTRSSRKKTCHGRAGYGGTGAASRFDPAGRSDSSLRSTEVPSAPTSHSRTSSRRLPATVLPSTAITTSPLRGPSPPSSPSPATNTIWNGSALDRTRPPPHGRGPAGSSRSAALECSRPATRRCNSLSSAGRSHSWLGPTEAVMAGSKLDKSIQSAGSTLLVEPPCEEICGGCGARHTPGATASGDSRRCPGGVAVWLQLGASKRKVESPEASCDALGDEKGPPPLGAELLVEKPEFWPSAEAGFPRRRSRSQ